MNDRGANCRRSGALACWIALGVPAIVLFARAGICQEEGPTARELLLSGRYEEAIAALAPDASPEPAQDLAAAHLAGGDAEAARRVLMDAARRHSMSATPLAELARLEFSLGNYDAAQKQAEAALRLDEESIAARWIQAELHRVRGEHDEAQKGYQWFLAHYNSGAAIKRPEDLHLVGVAIAQHARWTRNSAQFKRLVSDFYPAILAREPKYWPAHAEMARLFIEKYNEADALAAIAAGLAINPHAADLHVLRAQVALDKYDLATARSEIERALEINPQHLEAHRCQADILLADVRPAESIEVLEKARQLQPRDEQTLGRLAAAYAAVDGMEMGQPGPRMRAVIDEVSEHNPRCGEFHLAAGDALDLLRRYPQAAEQYRLAHEKMPQLLAARGNLGMTLMRLGEEAEAAKILEEAFAVDPFHVRVKNTLEVLDVLKAYSVLETEHFVIKFDRGQDELLATYASRYLEREVYPQLVEQFGYRPQGKTLIEIFSRAKNTSGHGWFSARMVGLPAIGTVGACAGKMVALTSPAELPKKYNWARVLRHEYVHVLNLQQTDFSIPHWFTEGLAVCSEGGPRPKVWNEVLARRHKEKSLFKLDGLTLGFVRPASSDDWTLAYCQAALYVDFMKSEFGDDAPSKMLAAYAQRKTTPEAIEQSFAIDQAEFETRYRKFVEKHLADHAPQSKSSRSSLAELERAAQAEDASAEALAALARAYLDRGKLPEARRWALAAQKKDERQPQAAYVLARLQVSIGDVESATTLLEKVLDKQMPDEDLLALLAALKLQAGDLQAAETHFELGRKHFPASDRWLKGLARIRLSQNVPDKLLPVLAGLAGFEPDSLSIRKKLAELSLEKRDFVAARRWATEVIQLDLQDAEGHSQLGGAAKGLGDFALAAEEYETAVKLMPQEHDWRLAWAEALVELGKKDEARQAADELKRQKADHPGLAPLLEKLNRE